MPGSAHAALRLIRGGIALALLLITTIGFVSAQELETTTPSSTGRTGSVELSVIPVASVPLGASSDLYTAGVGGCLGGHLRLPSLDWLVPSIDMAYTFSPVSDPPGATREVELSLSLVRIVGGTEVVWRPVPRVAAFAYGAGGAYYGFLSGARRGSAFGVAYQAGAGATFRITPAVGVMAGASYTSYVGLHTGISAFVGTRFSFGNTTGFQTGPEIRIYPPQFDTIFPVLFKYYDTHPLGNVRIENTGGKPLHEVEVHVEVPQYMDSTKACAKIAELAPGEVRDIELTALFTDDVLTITEGTKVTANVAVYSRESRDPVRTSATLATYDRNALRWDDDAKIAAFVTARDDEVQSFAKNVAALSRPMRVGAVSTALQLAMAEYSALIEHGTSYVVDPSSAYENLSQNPLAVDYVQFPRQTLQFRAGDCDDLSATYAALLEAVGVDTAFITVPGHIFMAFLLDMPADEAQSAFSRPQDLIIREDGSVWVPIETTVLEAGFNDAWAEGARQWREHAPEGRAGFFRTREAWNTYQPVAFSVSNVTIVPPREDRIATRFERTLKSFIDREIYDQAQRYAGILRRNPGDTRTRNRLGVLYARYGRHREARAEFQAVLARETYAPALVNLGNIAFVESSFGEAKEYYDRALEVTPYSGPALLGAARAASRLEDYEAARVSYERLARVDLELAERFAHLDPSQSDAVARASGEEALQRVLVWEEEE